MSWDILSLSSKDEQISKGGLSGTVCDGKIIFKIALDYMASSVILCHNHPSGQLQPSNEDLLLTSKMISFGKMIDLPILDHLIFTDNGYFSFADEGLMKWNVSESEKKDYYDNRSKASNNKIFCDESCH